MSLITFDGKDVALLIDGNPLALAQDATVTISADLLAGANKDDGKLEPAITGDYGATATSSTLTPVGSPFSVVERVFGQSAGSPVTVSLRRVNTDGPGKYLVFDAFISSVNVSFEKNVLSASSITLESTSAVETTNESS